MQLTGGDGGAVGGPVLRGFIERRPQLISVFGRHLFQGRDEGTKRMKTGVERDIRSAAP
jgi:hypothetical protein